MPNTTSKTPEIIEKNIYINFATRDQLDELDVWMLYEINKEQDTVRLAHLRTSRQLLARFIEQAS